MATYSPSKITKDGNTYNFTDDTKIPLAGTSALSGSIIPSTDNAYDLGDSSHSFSNIHTTNINSHNSRDLVMNYMQGGGIILRGLNTQVTGQEGYFVLRAYNGTNSYYLTGKPNGSLSWNSKNIAMQEDTVPRSGGAVMTSGALGRNTNADSLRVDGGTGYDDGASIGLSGKNRTGNEGIISIHPSTGTQYKQMVLKPDGTWTWNGSACVVGSDSRLKDEIDSISDDVLTAWENLEPKQYKYKSDLETDKDSAQVHYGWIAQDVESVIKGDRKGEVKNGLWLHETWEEQAEVSHEETYTEEVQTKSGETETVIKTRKVIDQPYRAKGDSYGLRYTECLVVECAYLRKKNKELQEQLNKVIARLDKLEGVQTK